MSERKLPAAHPLGSAIQYNSDAFFAEIGLCGE